MGFNWIKHDLGSPEGFLGMFAEGKLTLCREGINFGPVLSSQI